MVRPRANPGAERRTDVLRAGIAKPRPRRGHRGRGTSVEPHRTKSHTRVLEGPTESRAHLRLSAGNYLLQIGVPAVALDKWLRGYAGERANQEVSRWV